MICRTRIAIAVINAVLLSFLLNSFRGPMPKPPQLICGGVGLSESLTGFNGAIESHRSVDSAESFSLRYFNKPGLLEERDELSRYVVLRIIESVK